MSISVEKWPLVWDRGEAEIFATGAALHNLVFRLDDRLSVQPLAEAPWIGERSLDPTIPAHLRLLGGEWPCVPFGSTHIDPHHHGYGTDHAWHVTDQSPGTIALAIDYPQDHPVARLERRITGVAGEAAVDLELTVEIRRACEMPIGLHPIFRLPENGFRLMINAGDFAGGYSFPHEFEPGVSQLAQGADFGRLDAVPLASRGFADLSHPPARLREEIVQLAGMKGSVLLRYPDDGHAVQLDWNPLDFPSLVVWLSDRGRAAAPWSSRFRGIGIEPVMAFFDNADLAPHAPAHVAPGRRFAAGERWTTRYRISASSLTGGQG